MRTQPAIYLLFTLFISIQVTAADEKRDLSGIAGEYGGTVKRVEMTLWAALVTGRSEEKALALLFFPAQQRQAHTDRLRRLTDAFLASGQHRCDITGGVELLASYVKAKFAAHNALNAALEGVPQGSVTPCP